MKFGVQMFGADQLCRKDPEGFFRKLKKDGYQLIEPCIVLGQAGAGWSEEETEKYLSLGKKAGLSARSCHILTPEPAAAAESMVRLAKQHGFSQFVWNLPADLSEEACEEFAGICMEAADKLAQTGAQLLLHNGKEASVKRIDGQTAYEWVLSRCGGKVFAQPDAGWLLAGGEDPEAFLWRNASIVKSLHYKDMKKEGEGLTECGLGSGLLDVPACFQFSRAAEIPQFVDQDVFGADPAEDLEKAAGLLASLTQCRDHTKSILCILNTETGEVRRLRTFDRIIEAPNWLKDGDTLLYNSEGRIWKYSISADRETLMVTGACTQCNNDHVVSPDERFLAVSSCPEGAGFASYIYRIPMEGGKETQVTPNSPSFLHGWSPDGKELAYCAFRMKDGGMQVDVYGIPAQGGQEYALTENAGFNDGPEYDPDGKHIWFNSTRTGLMQIWRMERDGSHQTQMTFEDRNNWFAHVSPDGRKVINLSYSRDGLDAQEHLPNMQAELWLMNADGSGRRRLLEFFGGQGSINVNSWCADSVHAAFVMYELIHK